MIKWIRVSLACVVFVSVALASEPTTPPLATPATTQAADVNGVETIVIFRHGEKPANGLGQLTPQGLNRALALSSVLPKKFGKPDYLFAPDPRDKVRDHGGSFNYVRPLATIEPTAIKLEMPVQTPCGFTAIGTLNDELCKPQYAQSTIFVAWEHIYARNAAADLLRRFGADDKQVPAWPGKDYDSLYVVTITRTAGHIPTIAFVHDHEGLDGQSTEMPIPAAK